jgi:membrane protein YqaA with SNARE-associated domain
MHSFFSSLFQLFLSPVGLLVLGALDSSMLFFLPAAIDTAIVIMAARYREWFWAFPIVAMLGSLVGCAATYMVGHEVGEAGLARWISERRLKRIRASIDRRGAIAMGLTAVLPPPFPLTPFVLTSGALNLNRKKFFAAIAAARFVRFGIVGLLAFIYGRQILSWLESDIFAFVIATLIVIALIGTPISIYQVFKRTR